MSRLCPVLLMAFLALCPLQTLVAAWIPSSAADEPQEKALQPGDTAPAWKDLKGTDDKAHSSSDLPKDTVIIVCFTSNTCPYSVDYEDRLNALHHKLTSAGANAVLVAINSNGIADDDLDHMKQRAAKKEFGFAYLKDESQSVARAFGAVYTPEFFVLNKERKIIYKGAMDDVTDATKVSVRYVELAVEAALTGTETETKAVPARGCTIRFKRERRKASSRGAQ